MKILFTICGRAGSKGIKNKNIRDFVGLPLSYYTLSAIDLFLKKNTELEYDIAINSDSDILLKMLAENGMRPVSLIKRDPSLADDIIGKIDVIRNCMEEMERRNSTKYDVILDLDITSPLRQVKDIEELLRVHGLKKPDLTTSVAPARRNPFFNQVMTTDQGVKLVIESKFTARQQAPQVFDMNASLYAYSPNYLRTGKGVLDGYCEVIEMYDTGILDLDHEHDFELMEAIAQHLFSTNSGFGEIRDNIVNNAENIAITEENIDSYIDDNLRRREKKYNRLTNLICEKCHGILSVDAVECPHCGSKEMAGMLTDGK